MKLQVGFPKIESPFLTQDGRVSQAWLQFFIALWNRTGQGQGVSASDDQYTDGSVEGELDRLNDVVSSLPVFTVPPDEILSRIDAIDQKQQVIDDLLARINALESHIQNFTDLFQNIQDAQLSISPPNQTTLDNLILTNQPNNAAAQSATLTNAPIAGNPTAWCPLRYNGQIKNFPVW